MASVNLSSVIIPPYGGQRCDVDVFGCPPEASPRLYNFINHNGVVQLRSGVATVGSALDSNFTNIVRYRTHLGHLTTVVSTCAKLWGWSLDTIDWADLTDPENPLSSSGYTPTLFRIFPKNNKAYLIGVNGANDPICWDSESAMYSLVGGSPPKAKCIAVCNNRVLMANHGDGKESWVDVSDFNDFESGWGNVQLANLIDFPGAIIEMRELGMMTVAIYKEDSIYIATAQAANDPYSFELRFGGIEGPVSSMAVLTLPDTTQLYLTNTCEVMHFNGVNLTPLGRAVQAAIESIAHKPRLALARAFYDAKNRTANFIIPTDDVDALHNIIAIKIDDWSVWPQKYPENYDICACSTLVFEQNVRIGDLIYNIGSYLLPIGTMSMGYLEVVMGIGNQAVKFDGNTDTGTSIEGLIQTPMSLPDPEEPARLTDIQEIIPLYHGTPDTADLTMIRSVYGEDPVKDATSMDFSASRVLGYRGTSRWFGSELVVTADSEFKYRGLIVSGVPRGFK